VFERFTERARQVVVFSQDEARKLKHDFIGTEHVLLGLLREEEGLAARVLESLDVTLEEVRAQVARIRGEGDEPPLGQIPFTPRAKKVLELALREALALDHTYIGTEHILLALVRVDGVGERILLDFDADAETIRNEILRLLTSPGGRRKPRVPLPPTVAAREWQYRVETLAGPSDSWPEQLTAWSRDGWKLVSVVSEGDEYRAILERRG